jgi:hypothetical protein
VTTVRRRIEGVSWDLVTAELDDVGVASIGPILTAAECASLRDAFGDDARYRSTIDMRRHRFGAGTYRYFAYPLPRTVEQLRRALWPRLLPVARAWAERRARPAPWPDAFDEWIEVCHASGQTRPTPLILRYATGDWNALHRDLYGELVFPLQVVFGLDEPDVDYTGGEFVVVEQRPRAQSRATVRRITRGEGIVFTTRDRPTRTKRGWATAPMRHGSSVVRSGHRHALGVIFHDAA